MKSLADAAFFASMLIGVAWLVVWTAIEPGRRGKERWSPFAMREPARPADAAMPPAKSRHAWQRPRRGRR